MQLGLEASLFQPQKLKAGFRGAPLTIISFLGLIAALLSRGSRPDGEGVYGDTHG